MLSVRSCCSSSTTNCRPQACPGPCRFCFSLLDEGSGCDLMAPACAFGSIHKIKGFVKTRMPFGRLSVKVPTSLCDDSMDGFTRREGGVWLPIGATIRCVFLVNKEIAHGRSKSAVFFRPSPFCNKKNSPCQAAQRENRPSQASRSHFVDQKLGTRTCSAL